MHSTKISRTFLTSVFRWWDETLSPYNTGIGDSPKYQAAGGMGSIINSVDEVETAFTAGSFLERSFCSCSCPIQLTLTFYFIKFSSQFFPCHHISKYRKNIWKELVLNPGPFALLCYTGGNPDPVIVLFGTTSIG